MADPTDQDLWGGYLNSNWSSNDTLLKTARDSTVYDTAIDYTVLTTDRNFLINVDATAALRTITLPTVASAGNGFNIAIQKVDNGTNTVVVDGAGGELIDGQANYVLSFQYDVVNLTTDGVSWYIRSASVPLASTTIPGKVEKATAAEIKAETADKYSDALDMVNHPGIAKASGTVDTSSGSAVLSGGYKITSATRTATGLTTIVMDRTMANTDYQIVVTSSSITGSSPHDVIVNTAIAKTTTTFGIRMLEDTGAATNDIDGKFYFAVFGELA